MPFFTQYHGIACAGYLLEGVQNLITIYALILKMVRSGDVLPLVLLAPTDSIANGP